MAAPALAADGSAGSKNFAAPASVPNYFANESGPIIGGKADSRVVDPPNISPVAAPPRSVAAASGHHAAPRHVVKAKGHGRVHTASASHGKAGTRHVAAKGKSRAHVASARHTTKGAPKHRAS